MKKLKIVLSLSLITGSLAMSSGCAKSNLTEMIKAAGTNPADYDAEADTIYGKFWMKRRGHVIPTNAAPLAPLAPLDPLPRN